MTKAHEYAEEIKAWADGRVIQWKTHGGEWVDFDVTENSGPWDAFASVKWRIKPEPKKGWVRVAEHKSGPNTWADYDGRKESEIKGFHDFIRWLSPRLDFDYPEDYEGGA